MSKSLLPLLLAIGLAISLGAEAAKEGLYRWRDQNGTLQYSDFPPEGVESEFIEMKGSVKARPDAESSAEPSKEGAPAAAADKPKVYKEMEVLPEKDPALCKQAQNNLKALEAARIRITEPDGSQRILTEEEKEVQREQARKFIKINC